jgi:hypothetical protein
MVLAVGTCHTNQTILNDLERGPLPEKYSKRYEWIDGPQQKRVERKQEEKLLTSGFEPLTS